MSTFQVAVYDRGRRPPGDDLTYCMTHADTIVPGQRTGRFAGMNRAVHQSGARMLRRYAFSMTCRYGRPDDAVADRLHSYPA